MVLHNDDTLLEAVNISKYFGDVKVLDQASIELKRGEVHAILGANGAGKSTLVKIINGVYSDYEGDLLINGEKQRPKNPIEARALGVGMVHQELSLASNMTIAENVFLGRMPKNALGFADNKSMDEEAVKILNKLGLSSIDLHRKTGTYSVADQQLIEIAKLLSTQTDILLLDEPTSALSDVEIDLLFRVIRDLKEDGKGIFFITHKIEEIMEIADRVTVLRDGEKIATLDVDKNSKEFPRTLITMMIGSDQGDLLSMFPPKESNPGKVALSVENFCRTGEFHDIHFSVREGEILGIFGLKGAGRTELARAIVGADPRDCGVLRIGEEEVFVKAPYQAIPKGIALLPENRKTDGVVATMGVKENICLSTMGDAANIFGIINTGKEKSKAQLFKEKLNIKVDSLMMTVKRLSGGNQQKVVFGKCLATNCKVIILDEPTRGIDVGAKREIYKIIRDLVKEGLAVIIISSELPEIIGLADRAIVLREGSLVGELTDFEITKENLMNLAFSHLSA
jgi:ABC-type sugar transport system ATPase subunit